MTLHLDWPADLVERLTEEARQKELSLDAYLLQTVLEQKGTNSAPATDEAEKRRRRQAAAARIRESHRRGRIRKPDTEEFLAALNERSVHLSAPASYGLNYCSR
jgi:hypothetical protein